MFRTKGHEARSKSFPSNVDDCGWENTRDAEEEVKTGLASEAKTLKIKICLVGDEGVGKTSLIRRFVHSEFDESYLKTVGTVVRKMEIELPEKGIKATLMIWDIMGRRDFMDIFKDAYSKQTAGIVAVFDLTRPPTLDSLYEWIGRTGSSGEGVPIMVLANKADLAERIEVRDEDIERLCASMGCSWLKTSAKTGENVENAFSLLANEISEGF